MPHTMDWETSTGINSYEKANELYLTWLRNGWGDIRKNKNVMGFNHFSNKLTLN
jgi:hypothetical protein